MGEEAGKGGEEGEAGGCGELGVSRERALKEWEGQLADRMEDQDVGKTFDDAIGDTVKVERIVDSIIRDAEERARICAKAFDSVRSEASSVLI